MTRRAFPSPSALTSVLFAAATLVAGASCATTTDPPPDPGSITLQASLDGSNFEIDDDANLVLDGTGTMDWATVDDTKKDDLESGKNDNSYKGGSKEDDPCPGTEFGSIPNNKSDLKTFGIYEEAGTPGFLHLFWTRVQEPSGTTLLDFEFNQNADDCGNGVNPTRVEGDLLLEYRIVQGGAVATLKIREWTGSEWGDALDLSAIGAATGTINDSPIAAEDSDGLGALSPRTFGEASIDLDFIFDDQKCVSFGSAMVKSRASDSFTSQMKDFIGPTPINITNCGKVIIRKETDPDGATESFDFSHNLATDPDQGSSFALTDGGSKTFSGVLLGTGYHVTEDPAPSGFELVSIDCSASTGVTPTTDVATSTVSFDMEHVDDVVDCTFSNRARGKVIVEKVTSDGTGTFDFTSSTLSPAAFSLTTTAAGAAGKDSRTFADLVPGSFDVSESVPAGWKLVSATCDDGSSPSSIDVSAGETVTCTFVDARQRGAIDISKLYKHAASGSGSHPQAGVHFFVSGGELAAPVEVVTGANGHACVDGLVLSSFVGAYTVTEQLPTGYAPDGLLGKNVSVTQEASCPNGDAVAFSNTPLTDITVSVNSLVDGGTASTITCTGASPVTTGANGDGFLTLSNLLPGTYSCTIVVDP